LLLTFGTRTQFEWGLNLFSKIIIYFGWVSSTKKGPVQKTQSKNSTNSEQMRNLLVLAALEKRKGIKFLNYVLLPQGHRDTGGRRYGAVGSRVGLIIQRSSVRSRLAATSKLPVACVLPQTVDTGTPLCTFFIALHRDLLFWVGKVFFGTNKSCLTVCVFLCFINRTGSIGSRAWPGG
jgi:hypothetical protein